MPLIHRLASAPRHGAIVVCCALGLLLVNLGHYRPMTTHEVLLARTAWEMWESDDWIVPRFLGEVRLNKPPLGYWQAIGSYSVFGGLSEWSARLPQALAAAALAALTWQWGRRWYGNRVGVFAGLAQATMVHVLLQGRLAEVDMTLALLVAGALASFSAVDPNLACRRPSARGEDAISVRPWIWSFWICVSLSALAKGPVGPAMVAAVVAGQALIQWDGPAIRRLAFPPAMVAALLIAGLWPCCVAVRQPEAISIWWRESLGRFVRDPNDVVRHPFYYPLAALWLTLPWTAFWIQWLYRSRRRLTRWTRQGARTRFLMTWLLVPMALLSLSAGKQEHYLMPALMPCALWTGCASRLLARRPWIGSWRFPVGWLFAAAVIGGLSANLWIQPWSHGRRHTARWASTLHGDQPIALVGHSVLWLSGYVRRPLQRVLAPELLEIQLGRDHVDVLTTRTDLAALGRRWHVEVLSESPTDLGISEYKRPVLARIAVGGSPSLAGSRAPPRK